MKITVNRLILNSDAKFTSTKFGAWAGRKKLGRYLYIIKGWSREELDRIFRKTRSPSSHKLILRSARQLVVKSVAKILRQEMSVKNTRTIFVFKRSYLGSTELTRADMIKKLVKDLAKTILSKENIIAKFAYTEKKVNVVLKSAIYEL